MKYLLACFFFLIIITCYSQDFNGDYRSPLTIFKNKIDSTENFREETLFNVAIQINDLKDDGIVVIQDPRIPNNPLVYKIDSFTGITKNNGYDMSIYKCSAEHLDTPKEETIVLYYDEKKHLNIIVISSESSQAFFDLEIQ